MGLPLPDYRYGEVFYLLNNGTIFAPSFMNLRRVPAMHGFDPAMADSAACWLTTHPTLVPRRINEIYEVMKAAGDNFSK